MAEVGCEVRLELDHVKVVVVGATDEALAAIAFQIEGEAKVRAAVDTGFMRNAVYVVTKDEDNYGERSREARARAVDREVAPKRSLPEDASAAVVAGAEYSIFQEAAQPFLWPAAELVAGTRAGAEAERVFKRVVRDG